MSRFYQPCLSIGEPQTLLSAIVFSAYTLILPLIFGGDVDKKTQMFYVFGFLFSAAALGVVVSCYAADLEFQH